MIQFISLNKEKPYEIFKAKYDMALSSGQMGIEAISISSYNLAMNEVDSRYVNLKYIENEDFIFFTNYNSPKANSFDSHHQISVLIYWPKINTQIRIKAKIKKTSIEFNQKYFFERSKEKNALAISSNQSKPINSFNQVKENYKKSLISDDLKKCPKFWGGYAFTPYYFEFWEGHDFRLNKREVFEKNQNAWSHYLLQP